MNDDALYLIIGGMQKKNQAVKTDGICTCLTSSMGCGGGYIPMIVANSGLLQPIDRDYKSKGKAREEHLEFKNDEISHALRAENTAVFVKLDRGEDMRIRKLTPKECWRLMGFSDEDFEKAEKVNSNTQLYKQAGNSIVVDVLEELFCMMLDEDGNIFV